MDQQVKIALLAWQREQEAVTDHARRVRQAMIRYAEGDGPSPDDEIRQLEILRARADALGRDLVFLVRQLRV